ncbi:hypothetical protein QEM13_003427 [Pseudomonas putida]|nr:hypothetical protein [Pseudomonas sp. p1(2021b)]EKT4524145.1 hypothetical protein [Pseudomonas putida]UBM27274.1 hypothetical protein K8374_10110 [Pseudomonas sp. p1(2021b)]
MAILIGLVVLAILFFVLSFSLFESRRAARHRKMKQAKSKVFKKGT